MEKQGIKYVFFSPTWATTEQLFSELNQLPDVGYYGSICKNANIRKIISSVFNGKLSFLPFKRIWWLAITKPEIIGPSVFVFLGGFNILIGYKFMERFRAKWRNTKFVAYFTDVNNMKKYKIDELKKRFDYVISFNKEESNKHEINYCPLPIPHYCKSDIAFVGQAKDRLDDIIKIYDYLEQNGVVCNFILTNVDSKNQIQRKGIRYLSSVSHDLSIIYILNTNCVLEIKNKSTEAHSDRVEKAIIFNKKIVSNNMSLINHKYYNVSMFNLFEKLRDIDIDFIKNQVPNHYNYSTEYSANHFLDAIRELVGYK